MIQTSSASDQASLNSVTELWLYISPALLAKNHCLPDSLSLRLVRWCGIPYQTTSVILLLAEIYFENI